MGQIVPILLGDDILLFLRKDHTSAVASSLEENDGPFVDMRFDNELDGLCRNEEGESTNWKHEEQGAGDSAVREAIGDIITSAVGAAIGTTRIRKEQRRQTEELKEQTRLLKEAIRRNNK